MGLKTGMLESPLVVRVFDDTTSGIVQSRRELDHFLTGITRRHPEEEELAPLYRTVYHRIYWGWRGVEHIIANAVAKVARWDGCQCRVERTARRPPMTGSAQPGEVGSAVTNGRPQARTIPPEPSRYLAALVGL